MSHLARWYVLLGVMALLPAAVLVGAASGEILRHPSAGLGELLRHEAVVIPLLVVGTFLLSTAAGLHDSRGWARVLAMAEALLLAAVGALVLVAGPRLLAAFGLPPVLTLATLPLALMAAVLGTRLAWSLWRVDGALARLARSDLRALGMLLAVAAMGLVSHIAVASVSL